VQETNLRVRPDGRRITARDARTGMRFNILAGSLGMAWFAVGFSMPFTMLMEALGAGGLLIGLAATIRQSTMLLQIPGSLYAERLSARRPFVVRMNLLQRAIWLLAAFIPLIAWQGRLSAVWVLLGVVTVTSILAQLSTAPWHSWMADLVPAGLRGRFWARRQAFTMVAYLAATCAAGAILDRHAGGSPGGRPLRGFTVVFGFAALLGVIDILLHLKIPEPKPRPVPEDAGLLQRVAAPLKNREFRLLSLGMGVWFMAVSLAAQFGIVYLKRSFQVEYTHLALLAVCGSISTLLASTLWGYVIDRIGARALAVLLMAVAPLLGCAWFFCSDTVFEWRLPLIGAVRIAQPIVLLALTGLVSGGLYSGVHLCRMALQGALAPRQGRTTAMGVHWTIVGLLGSLGPLIGGAVMDWFGAHPPSIRLPTGIPLSFIHVLVLARAGCVWFFAIPLMLRIRPRPDELPVGSALARVIMMNPLRVVSSIYNIRMITAPVAHGRRARAAWALGEQKTALAVADLIEKLDDPAIDVREAAARALGRIGSRDAVDALLGKLEEPGNDLAPHIARALRHANDPRSVSALVRTLREPDRETQREAARTLGALGDPRAKPPLLGLLRDTADDTIASASSDALARLGEIAAIHEIVPRMRSTCNPVLRRSLAVAAGDLLGERDGFYKVLNEEQTTHGSAVETLGRTLRRRIRRATRHAPDGDGEQLIAQVRQFEASYENEQHCDCADRLVALARGLAAQRYDTGRGPDARALAAQLARLDERFAVGLWYLVLLQESFAKTTAGPGCVDDHPDILLGLYFLSRWSRRLRPRARVA